MSHLFQVHIFLSGATRHSRLPAVLDAAVIVEQNASSIDRLIQLPSAESRMGLALIAIVGSRSVASMFFSHADILRWFTGAQLSSALSIFRAQPWLLM